MEDQPALQQRALHVVAALIDDDRGRVLIAQRPLGKQHAGLWEFPGGKIEPGETALVALRRELREELGIDGVSAVRLMSVIEPHNDFSLHLHAWRVLDFHGQPRAIEASALRWSAPDELPMDRMPPADLPIARSLQWPAHYCISPDAAQLGSAGLLDLVRAALAAGERLIRVRCADPRTRLPPSLLRDCEELVMVGGARLMVDLTDRAACRQAGTGIHLRANDLKGACSIPAGCPVFASCHTLDELRTAELLGVDAVVISPVFATRTHPDQPGLLWSGFQQLHEQTTLPAFALGGLKPSHLGLARDYGAIGIAGISGFMSIGPT